MSASLPDRWQHRCPFLPGSCARQRGQMMIVVPILLLLIVGAFLLAMNLSKIVNERIKIQTAGDAAARDGAYVQAQALGAISILNDGIVAADAQIATGLGQIADAIAHGWPVNPFAWPEWLKGVENVKEGRDTGTRLQKVQQNIERILPGLVEAVVVAEAYQNGKYAGSVVPGASHLSLDLKDSFVIFPFVPLRMRDRETIQEKVVVLVAKPSGTNVPLLGEPLLRGLDGGGEELHYPFMIANSAAKPYFYGFGHDPRDDNLNANERFFGMLLPGFGWEAKLTRLRGAQAEGE